MKRIVVLLAFLSLVPSASAVCSTMTAPYGAAAVITLCPWKTDASALKTDATFAAGDLKVSQDGGTETNCTTTSGACVVDTGSCYSVTLTATEMTGKRIQVLLSKSATILDECAMIYTYGNASAFHSTSPSVNVTQWNGTNVATPSVPGKPEVTAASSVSSSRKW